MTGIKKVNKVKLAAFKFDLENFLPSHDSPVPGLRMKKEMSFFEFSFSYFFQKNIKKVKNNNLAIKKILEVSPAKPGLSNFYPENRS